jgi:tRNA A-37 threonylcarbamoyl transferase component Bud32
MRNNMTLAEFEALTQDAKILEQDFTSAKVLQLPDQRIVKLFRRKRLISSQIWAPHAWRFCRNARILKERGIPTISVDSYFEIREIDRQAVVYHRIEGTTLRDWMIKSDKSERIEMIAKLGVFIAQMHEVGILFRSLHFGNILVMDDCELALIDIVDMGFRYHGSLSVGQRIRNFHHMDRYDSDRAELAANRGEGFIEHYLKNSKLSTKQKPRVEKGFSNIFNKYSVKAHV